MIWESNFIVNMLTCIISGAGFATAVTPIRTFALSTTDKTKILSDANKDTISNVCLLIANVKSASACQHGYYAGYFFAFRNFTGTVVVWHLPTCLSANHGIKQSYKTCLLRT